MSKFSLPNPRRAQDPKQIGKYLIDLTNVIEQSFYTIPPFPVNKERYILNTNVQRREIDPSTATLQEVAEFVNTLAKDLNDAGVLSAKER